MSARCKAQERQSLGILCGVLSVLLFSSFTLVSRLGFASSMTVPDLVALRFGIGGVLMLPVLLHYGFRGVRSRDAAALTLLGGLGFALLAYTGFRLAPAAHGAALLHGTLSLFTFALLTLTSRQQFTQRQTIGVGLIAIGIALMASDSLFGANFSQLIGDGMLLLASLFFSAYGVTIQRLGLPPAQGAAIVAVVSMCCFLPPYAFFYGKHLLLVDAHELLLQAVVQGVLIGAVAISVYTRAIFELGPAKATLFTAAIPCLTTLAAVPLLSEFPTLSGSMGVCAVTLGMIVAMTSRKTDGMESALLPHRVLYAHCDEG